MLGETVKVLGETVKVKALDEEGKYRGLNRLEAAVSHLSHFEHVVVLGAVSQEEATNILSYCTAELRSCKYI